MQGKGREGKKWKDFHTGENVKRLRFLSRPLWFPSSMLMCSLHIKSFPHFPVVLKQLTVFLWHKLEKKCSSLASFSLTWVYAHSFLQLKVRLGCINTVTIPTTYLPVRYSPGTWPKVTCFQFWWILANRPWATELACCSVAEFSSSIQHLHTNLWSSTENTGTNVAEHERIALIGNSLHTLKAIHPMLSFLVSFLAHELIRKYVQ